MSTMTLDRTFVTSQNHGYAVIGDSIDPNIAEVSHFNANDGTCEGMRYKNINAFTVQFHPKPTADRRILNICLMNL